MPYALPLVFPLIGRPATARSASVYQARGDLRVSRQTEPTNRVQDAAGARYGMTIAHWREVVGQPSFSISQ